MPVVISSTAQIADGTRTMVSYVIDGPFQKGRFTNESHSFKISLADELIKSRPDVLISRIVAEIINANGDTEAVQLESAPAPQRMSVYIDSFDNKRLECRFLISDLAITNKLSIYPDYIQIQRIQLFVTVELHKHALTLDPQEGDIFSFRLNERDIQQPIEQIENNQPHNDIFMALFGLMWGIFNLAILTSGTT